MYFLTLPLIFEVIRIVTSDCNYHKLAHNANRCMEQFQNDCEVASDYCLYSNQKFPSCINKRLVKEADSCDNREGQAKYSDRIKQSFENLCDDRDTQIEIENCRNKEAGGGGKKRDKHNSDFHINQ